MCETHTISCGDHTRDELTWHPKSTRQKRGHRRSTTSIKVRYSKLVREIRSEYPHIELVETKREAVREEGGLLRESRVEHRTSHCPLMTKLSIPAECSRSCISAQEFDRAGIGQSRNEENQRATDSGMGRASSDFFSVAYGPGCRYFTDAQARHEPLWRWIRGPG